MHLMANAVLNQCNLRQLLFVYDFFLASKLRVLTGDVLTQPTTGKEDCYDELSQHRQWNKPRLG